MGRAFEVRKQSMAKTAAKKSKLYSRYGKEIYLAAKNGTDLEANLELKRIVEKAKKDQVPKEIIERAIDKAKGGVGEDYVSTRYEFIGPGNSYFIVECLTDNVARTIANVRNCFTKTGGKSGSVLHNFQHRSVLAVKGLTEEDILEILIENDLDVEDFEQEDDMVAIVSLPQYHSDIREALLKARPEIEFEIDEIAWVTEMYQTLTNEEKEQYEKLMDLLDEEEDVQKVYHNVTEEN